MMVGELTADGRARVLADGNQMPVLGLGVWQVPDGAVCVNAVRWALDLGIAISTRPRSTATRRASAGRCAIAGYPAMRFVTTKFHPDRADPVAEAKQSLRRLGVDQVDLYLVHWPHGDPAWAWPGMERCLERNLARSIGISNFGTSEQAAVLAAGTIPPVVNRVKFSPVCYRRAPTHQERIRENAQIFDFTLSPADMAELDALDRTKGAGQARERNIWRGALRRARAVIPIRRTS